MTSVAFLMFCAAALPGTAEVAVAYAHKLAATSGLAGGQLRGALLSVRWPAASAPPLKILRGLLALLETAATAQR